MGWKLSRCVWVMDRGMISEENRRQPKVVAIRIDKGKMGGKNIGSGNNPLR